ncbi:MAG: YtxH domain-containing protein [bacterium]
MGKIMKSLTIGGLVGFVAGLLFAPQKGEENRQKLKEAVEKGKEKFNELKDEINKKGKDCCGS